MFVALSPGTRKAQLEIKNWPTHYKSKMLSRKSEQYTNLLLCMNCYVTMYCPPSYWSLASYNSQCSQTYFLTCGALMCLRIKWSKAIWMTPGSTHCTGSVWSWQSLEHRVCHSLSVCVLCMSVLLVPHVFIVTKKCKVLLRQQCVCVCVCACEGITCVNKALEGIHNSWKTLL